MTTKKQLLGKIDYYSGVKTRENYFKEDATIGGIVKVANMERQITEIFGEFLNRLSNLQYDFNGNFSYGSNFSKEDLEEIENTKKNMKEFAAKKLARANELVDIMFSQVGAQKAVVVIGKVPTDTTGPKEDEEPEEKAKSDDIEDVKEDVNLYAKKKGTNSSGDQSGDNNSHFYDDKENKYKFDAKSLEKFVGKTVMITKKMKTKIYGVLIGFNTDGRSIIIGNGKYVALEDIAEIKEFRS